MLGLTRAAVPSRPGVQQIAAGLQHRLISWFAPQPRYVPKAPSNGGRAFDQEAIERLRNLGYVGE